MDSKPELPQIITVKSSAGSGKTYRLAQHYIALLILDTLKGGSARNRISSLVAITFTNKAAQEMRARIIDWIKRIILDIPLKKSTQTALDDILDNEWLSQYISACGMLTPDNHVFFKEAVRTSLIKDFDELLKNYYSFNVGTIDGFVNLILKASAFKLNLPPDFEISLESSTIIDLVVKECLLKITENERVQWLFDRFTDRYIETEGDNASWLPRDVLIDIISSLWNEESREDKQFVSDRFVTTSNDLKKEIESIALRLKDSFISRPEFLLKSNFLKAVESCITLEGNVPGTSSLFHYALSKCLKISSAPAEPEQENLWKALLDARITYVEHIAENKFSPYIAVYDLFKEILNLEITRRKKLVLIDQLNKLLQKVIEEAAFVPEIYYALAERYTHFLVDEFQDTNYLQWKNIEVLTEEAIARGGTLFLVGDKKQAIYRWRGGRAELVDEIATHYRSYPAQTQILDRNYRSAGHIVEFNNSVFNRNHLSGLIAMLLPNHSSANRDTILDTYSNAEQIPLDKKKRDGLVFIEQLIDAENDDEDPVDSFTKDNYTEIITVKLKTLLSNILGKGQYNKNDIAVLVRKKDEARLVVKTLLEMGINVDSEQTTDVRNNLIIREMIHFLRFIQTPSDDLSFASFIGGIIFEKRTGINRSAIHHWMSSERISEHSSHLYKAFQSEYPSVWEELFEFFFVRSGYLPLYECIILLIKKWFILRNFSDEIPYIMHLCEMLKKGEDSGSNNLSSFLRLFELTSVHQQENSFRESSKSFLLKSSEMDDAVKVLTIHKAKGLEFPVVILPFLKLNSFSTSDGRNKTRYFITEGNRLKLFYVKKDFCQISSKLADMHDNREKDYLLDELNNTYVALTRAEKELHIFLAHGKGAKKNYYIDYFFNHPDFQQFISENRIILGYSDTALTGEENNPAAVAKQYMAKQGMNDQGPFYNLPEKDGEDWMNMIGMKIAETSTVSMKQLLAKKRGDLIHFILSLITVLPDQYSDYLGHCIHSGIAKHPAIASPDDLKETLMAFFRNKIFIKFFRPEINAIIYTEKEIIDENGNVFKIDRLIIHENSVDIIDYKSGEKNPEKHMEQIETYRKLVKRIYPDRYIRAYILYIEEGKAVTI